MAKRSQQLGKYRIDSEIGRGGFATVYRATDTELGRSVALKVLYPNLLHDPSFVQRFKHEAQTTATLRHPNIITIYEASESNNRLFIAMDLADQGSLANLIKVRGSLPWAEALALLQPLCNALDYIHARGIVHRDLKPANVLLDAKGAPMLSDFGFAHLGGENSVSLSLERKIAGSSRYIPIEVWDGQPAEVPADIYALGCIAYELLIGKPLFDAKTLAHTMRLHDRGPQFPIAWPTGIPGGIEAVLGKALARDPGKRYTNASMFLQALVDLEIAQEPTATEQLPVERNSEPAVPGHQKQEVVERQQVEAELRQRIDEVRSNLDRDFLGTILDLVQLEQDVNQAAQQPETADMARKFQSRLNPLRRQARNKLTSAEIDQQLLNAGDALKQHSLHRCADILKAVASITDNDDLKTRLVPLHSLLSLVAHNEARNAEYR